MSLLSDTSITPTFAVRPVIGLATLQGSVRGNESTPLSTPIAGAFSVKERDTASM